VLRTMSVQLWGTCRKGGRAEHHFALEGEAPAALLQLRQRVDVFSDSFDSSSQAAIPVKRGLQAPVQA